MSNLVITKLPRDKEHPFTMNSNDKAAFNWDERLSAGAYGILCKVLSLNTEKDFSVEWLCKLLNIGRTAAHNRLKELEQFGYLIKERIRDELGRYKKIIYRFFEVPQINGSEQEGEKPSNPNDCPRSKKPNLANQPQSNTASSSNTSFESVSPALNSVENPVENNQTDGFQSEPEKKTENNNTHKPMPFREMLWYMQTEQTTLLNRDNYWDSIFDSEDSFREYFGEFDPEEWEIQNWQIPDAFRHNPATMENALKFLTGFNDMKNDEFKAFLDENIGYLAEALYTEKSSYTTTVLNPDRLMSKLNYINCDIYGEDESLLHFMEGFYMHFQKQIVRYPIRSNRKGYITKMLINYLNGEHQTGNMLANAHIRSMEEN